MATHLQGTKPVCPYSRPTSCGQFAKGRPHLSLSSLSIGMPPLVTEPLVCRVVVNYPLAPIAN